MLEATLTKGQLAAKAKVRRGSDHEPGTEALLPLRSARADRPFVVAQLGQSLDGRIATLSGESRWINGEPALDHVHRLRANVDAVVVGVGTAVTDNPRLTVRRTHGPNPARVVIDPRGRLPETMHCLEDDGVRRIVVRDAGVPCAQHAETLNIASQDSQLCPREIVNKLFETGLKKLLIEGGARTVSSFIDADVVDRLHILVAPVILGSGKQGLQLAPIKRLVEAHRPETTAYVLDGGEVLFDCNLRRKQYDR